MTALQKKINSQDGVSILLALLLLLVALMVSVLMVSAAVSSASRIRADRLNQQAYYNVSSAAKLMREKIVADTHSETVYTYYSDSNHATYIGTETVTQPASGSFSALLEDTVSQADGATKDFTLTAENMDPVVVSFTMDAQHNIMAVFHLEDSPQQDCYMTLKISANVTTTQSSGQIAQKYFSAQTTTISWDVNTARISKGVQ